MGLTYIEGQAQAPDGREATVTFLVDSGIGYSLLPYRVWQSLGLQPTREERFPLPDGTVAIRNMSNCFLKLPQGEEYTPVILGEPGDDQALLSWVSLGSLGLMLNPFSRTLHPMRLML